MEMTSIGFIQDKEGKKYEVKNRTKKRNDRTRYYLTIFDEDREIGSVEFNVYDGDDYAEIEFSGIDDIRYRNKGIYTALLLFAKDFFKKQGLKGIFSEGKLRSEVAGKTWDKIKDKKIMDVDVDGKKYQDYTLEHLKTFSVFEKETEYTLYTNKKGGKFWGDMGAGVLIICSATGRILVAMRGDQVNEPNTWGVFGGKMDPEDKTPEDAAKRELTEESGYRGKFEIVPAYVYVAPGKVFTYYNFLGIVEKEFEPEYDWETNYAEWMTLDELISAKPKHFGLKKLLEKSMDLIKKYVR
jgi:8-oxo-dGTP pyrophosphatase MutT (NUDIX family)